MTYEIYNPTVFIVYFLKNASKIFFLPLSLDMVTRNDEQLYDKLGQDDKITIVGDFVFTTNAKRHRQNKMIIVVIRFFKQWLHALFVNQSLGDLERL